MRSLLAMTAESVSLLSSTEIYPPVPAEALASARTLANIWYVPAEGRVIDNPVFSNVGQVWLILNGELAKDAIALVWVIGLV